MSLNYSEWNSDNTINNTTNNTNTTNNKRKTLKKLPSLNNLLNNKKSEDASNSNKDSPKNEDVVSSNVYMIGGGDEDDSGLADYKPSFDPPPPPQLSKVGQTKHVLSASDDTINPEDYSQLDAIANDQYLKKLIPGYNGNGEMPGQMQGLMQSQMQGQMQSQMQSQMQIGSENNLSDKLNYMIHLLEENREEKTSNVVEELILYSFLGVFVIFVLDNFVKIGNKYTR